MNEIRQARNRLGLSQAKLAELAQVPQHLISAYELGKSDLRPSMLNAVRSVLSDEDRVAEVAARRKRYREHKYEESPRLRERIDRAGPTDGNAGYLEAITDLSISHRTAKKRGPKAISLFSGCGGFSLGFSAAGYQIKGFLELEPGLRQIYKDNFSRCEELGGDITEVSDEQLSRYVDSLGYVDVIIGGPPCQGFSLSGKRDVADPRNRLFQHYLRFVDAFKPRIAVVENVRLLTSMKSQTGTYVKDDICREFARHGYRISLFEVNAKDFGVPQHRERVFFIAIRDDQNVAPSIPHPTHGASRDLFSDGQPHRTFGDACSDLEYLESGEQSEDPLHTAVKHPAHVIEWLWNVPQGCSAHDNEDESLRPPSGYNTTYKRQVWAEPASTVQTTFGMISGCRNVHPIATRSLTIREAARIQSFPDDYLFSGTLSTIRTGIGNAVPPLLAFTIAEHLRPYLK